MITIIYENSCTVLIEFLEQLKDQGLYGLPDLVRIILIEAMCIKRESYQVAKAYERSAERQRQANGFKLKTIKARISEVTIDIPQVRKGEFYPRSLEKGMRSARAFLMTLPEMYVQGVFTRKGTAITEQLCVPQVNPGHVSRAMQTLDEELEVGVIDRWEKLSI